MIPAEPPQCEDIVCCTGDPFRCQIMVPFTGLSVHYSNGCNNDHWAVWTALDVKRLR